MNTIAEQIRFSNIIDIFVDGFKLVNPINCTHESPIIVHFVISNHVNISIS